VTTPPNSSSGDGDPAAPRAPAAAADAPPLPDRRGRDRRAGAERRQKAVPVVVDRRTGVDRRKEGDRRADAGKRAGSYDLDAETMEFIHAVSAFKERTGAAFPTWSDILGILRELGYEKRRP
jgi:hypothetical protein